MQASTPSVQFTVTTEWARRDLLIDAFSQAVAAGEELAEIHTNANLFCMHIMYEKGELP